ncbi:MAG: AAA family ATPase [Deltaproteobacteria bacterium]|nr:AAA family ATPase [Deltaproteobacteria bacterium]
MKKIEVDASTDIAHVEIDSLRIRLARPLELDFNWVGNSGVLDQLLASWHCSGGDSTPMNPRLIGKPGVGKTALAYSVGKMLNQPVFFFQATSDTQPNDVLISTVIVETGKETSTVHYIASSLVTAMIVGGVIVFDEGNRMQEKAWAALAPLLDSRRYIESVTAGVVIRAHPKFRFVSTMNDDASCFDLPEYIKSRLQPQILLDFPDRSEERKILEQNLPHANPVVLDYVADFLELAHKESDRFTVREGIHIANYASKMIDYHSQNGKKIDPGKAVVLAVEQVLGVRQTRYIKRVLWGEQEAA